MSEAAAGQGEATAVVESIAGNAIGDHPAAVDSLGFAPYVEAIAQFLMAPATHPPMTVSIEGEWGSGKSSFMLQLESAIGGRHPRTPLWTRLPAWLGGLDQRSSANPAKRPLCVRFNAWRHDKQDALWAAFALSFLKALRKEVGLGRAWWGDIQLFLKRLAGIRAWFELALLVGALVLLGAGVFLFWRIASTYPDVARRLLGFLTGEGQKEGGGQGGDVARILGFIASSGTLGLTFSLGLAGLGKFRSILKMPLSVKLEKYISKPDYEGHVSFIESFHTDLNRLVEAYAGDQRVFIFIDDLDRCDVPRAAELMQAINLMIGDTKNLIFVLGMDREKVAAGIAQKYKDILPFLRDSAHWKPNDEKDNYTPLYFGYGYLEKFIQISFSLPIPGDEKALDSFFSEQVQQAQPRWLERLSAYWGERFSFLAFRRAPRDDGAVSETASDQTAPGAPEPASPESDRSYYRLDVERDSQRIRKVVQMVGAVFEYNPRRIKQFINTFRLSLYIASDQGLLDGRGGQRHGVTPEQIGKVVALLLKFPDLRFALEQDPHVLSKLQRAALDEQAEPSPALHWLGKPGARSLLAHGCDAEQDRETYSLENFNVAQLISVLPRAPRPPPPRAYVNPFADLARQYETIRRTELPGLTRTRHMAWVANEARRRAEEMLVSERLRVLESLDDQPGSRLMRIMINLAHPDPANLNGLIAYNWNFLSPFEHHRCIQALWAHRSLMTAAQRAEIADGLEANWSKIAADQGRLGSAERLLKALRSSPTSGGSRKVGSQSDSSGATSSPRRQSPAEIARNSKSQF